MAPLPTVRLTKTRREILSLLADFTFLRTSHFYDLLTATDERGIRRILRDFSEWGFITAKPIVEYIPGQRLPHWENVYHPTDKGFDLIDAEHLYNGFLNRFSQVSQNRIGHEIGITEFHLFAKRFCSAHSLELYWQQTELKKSEGIPHPDAYFAITNPRLPEGRNTVNYFLEFQNAATGHIVNHKSDETRKFERYAEYHSTDQCGEDWGFRRFHVVFAFSGTARAERVLTNIAARYPTDLFWIAAQDDIKKDEAVPFHTPADAAPRPLFPLSADPCGS